MLVKLIPHSTLRGLFPEESYEINLDSYADVYSYLGNIQPKFSKWVSEIEHNEERLPVALVKKDGEFLLPTDYIKTPVEGETLYIVPMFCGGKGRAGRLIAGALLIAAAAYTGGLSLGASGFAWGATGSGLFVAKTALNLGIAVAASAFIREPKQPENSQTVDQNTREGDQFGPLQPTQGEGSILPMAFGEVRVAGHRITGFVDTIEGGRGDEVTLSDKYNLSPNPTTKSSGRI